jgi:hypothetical protein
LKKQLIIVSKPENNNSELDILLKGKGDYFIKEAKVKKIKRAFVTYDGLIFKNLLIPKRSAFNLRGKLDNSFYYVFWKRVFERYVVAKFGKSIPSIKLDSNSNYLVIHSYWFNYSFWITSYLPRLIEGLEYYKENNLKLIVPEDWKNIPYVWESLKAFNITHEIIPKDHHIFVKNLILPETREWTASFEPKTILKTKDFLIREAYKRVPKNFKKPSEIYLTRGRKGTRCVENEDEVIKTIKLKGFEVISFENYTIWEQIVLISNASSFISIHGAGLSNLMFMKQGSNVLELINKEYASLEYTFPFWKLANIVKLKYYMQLCPIKENVRMELQFGKSKTEKIENINNYLVNQNIIVDCDILKTNLDLMGYR